MFIGRKEYLDDLQALWRKCTSSIIACRGRRRIGKSTLFREFARRTAGAYLEFEGLPPNGKNSPDNADQLNHFATALARQTNTPIVPVMNWYDAFFWLDQRIDDTKKTVVLLDEISWMGAADPNFPGVLRTAWETFLHRHEHLIVIVCGSVSAWIKRNILDNTGFTGRFSRDYVLPELSLDESAQFWGAALPHTSSRDILDVLSVTGGIPRYLEEIEVGMPADETIRRLCFSPSGELFQDFDAIFNPLFGKDAEVKRKILMELCAGPRNGSEIAKALKIERNGKLAEYLRELEEAGFVSCDMGKNPLTGGEMRVGKYRLRDNYSRFYLKYIEPHKREILRGAYNFTSLEALPQWNAMMGLQFENLIVNNATGLLPYLGLGRTVIESMAPYRNVRKLRGEEAVGCQIDLLIQTARSAYVVEVKRKNFIGEDIEAEVEKKIKRLPLKANVSVRPVLVYDGELAPAVEASGYFAAVVPAERLLGR